MLRFTIDIVCDGACGQSGSTSMFSAQPLGKPDVEDAVRDAVRHGWRMEIVRGKLKALCPECAKIKN